MICTCPISGISWNMSDFPTKTRVSSPHPIFAMSTGQLLNTWEQTGIVGRLSEDSIKLISIAALIKTGLVITGKCPIDLHSYSTTTARTVIMPLFSMIDALKHAPMLREELPRYRIAHYHSIDTLAPSLDNLTDVVNVWRSELEALRREYRREHKINLEKIDALTRLIMSGTKPIKAARHLANYVADNIGFPRKPVGTSKGIMSMRDYWIELLVLCAKVSNNEGFNVLLYGTELEDLELLLAHIQDNSGHGDTFIYQAIALIKKGIASYNDIFTPVMLDSSTISHQGQTLAITIQECIAKNMPAAKPIISDYPNKVDYFRALSAWNLNKGK